MASSISQTASTPAEVSSISDDDLRAFVVSVIKGLNDNADAPEAPASVAPFITAGVLLRLHNIVQDIRRQGDKCGGWPKQAVVALAVASFTGVRLRRSDAEYIGNRQDAYLAQHMKEVKKAGISGRQDAFKARKKSLPPPQPSKADALAQRLYTCSYGGVPRVAATGSMPVHNQPVPVRTVEPLEQLNAQLQQEIMELKQEDKGERDRQHTMNALCAAVEAEREARKEAEARLGEAENEREREAAAALARLVELKARVQEADKERVQLEGRLARLGSQVTTAHVELARAQERHEKAQEEARKAVVELANGRATASKEAEARVAHLKTKAKEAEQERQAAAGQVARLGSQVTAAHVEVEQALEREEKVREEAHKAAADAAAQRTEAVAEVTQQLRKTQQDLREQREEGRGAAGRLERLGSQLGTALVEAARATERAREADTSIAALRARLDEQEGEFEKKLEHVRSLKNAMAKRARNADKRAEKADSWKAALDSSKAKLREMRKAMNSTRVQLDLEAQDESDESDSDPESEAESVSAEADSSEDEARMALERVRAMPTWRPVNGKGHRGHAKMEWGTTVIIYALLAMMVPASAVGMAIVAIVKRTAPWLRPVAPTYETVKRCRFELRFVEEVCRSASRLQRS